ncbi:L-lactate permease [Teredinibacter turnerae T7901]|uniref:L-lactate permease n=1 Tax=Teredinibacter turnerae (strain ATCC 39867 / T7901) TaxID=377629 RepID=C5BPR0_TERTT|nr:L-lactate permease [Teredinibacter turnerae]ACR11716.1 L-lactate permease [Teredinibacter turnerae T7901]
MPLFFSYFPIVFLIYLMTRRNSMPSYKALPLCALLLYFIMLVVFARDPVLVHAAVLDGLLIAWTPIVIIAGAIFLFRTMEVTGAQATIRAWLNTVSENKIAQLMIVGWAFQFLIEGASGFGTPAALAAPVLVGLGFPAVRVAILCLILDTVPVSFGAVGTPTWFGFSAIDLSAAEITEIGIKSSVINGIAAFVVVFIALSFLVDRKALVQNAVFIVLSILACVLPYVAIAFVSYEFPALLGGGIGLVLTIAFARLGWGLSQAPINVRDFQERDSQERDGEATRPQVTLGALLKASFPLWGTVLLLIVTRIPQLGIKELLLLKEPAWILELGSLGVLSVSASLVVSLQSIFNTPETWSHSLLYVPSFIPFGVISLITLYLYRSGQGRRVVTETLVQMQNPVLALLGALVFVNLMMMGGEQSAVALIGQSLAELTGAYWQFFAPFLGALGSFFSGSNTISNLTFGGIQDSIALGLGLDRTTILALQSVGGAMGNMVCINNIVAVASVLALGNKEGYIIKRAVLAMLAYGVVAGILGVLI